MVTIQSFGHVMLQGRGVRCAAAWLTALAGTVALACAPADNEVAVDAGDAVTDQFNVLLVVFEDLSPRIGAFGDDVATTPVLDAFAREAIRFPNTFTTAGVCAPSRAALMTGVYQQRLGAQHMRTRAFIAGRSSGGPVPYDAVPPDEVKAFPELLRAGGYYTSNDAKKDYQFGSPFTIWDESAAGARWDKRTDGQPFFSMITLMRTHESYLWPEDLESGGGLGDDLAKFVAARNRRELEGKPRVTDPASVVVPPYYPDTEVIRADLARQYDNLAFEERRFTEILEQLERDGLEDSTVVIVTTDHGDGLPRMKRTVYDSGIRVPMMVRFPDRRGAGEVREDLISFVDLAPTILELAGQDLPDYLDGFPFVDRVGGGLTAKHDYIYAAADRHDAVPGRTRAVRDRRFKYMRNFMPEVPLYEHLDFRAVLPTMKELRRLHADGALNAAQAAGFLTPRPSEELYDLDVDPFEVSNLAGDPAFAVERDRLAAELESWLASIGPRDGVPEAELVHDLWSGADSQPPTVDPVADLDVQNDGRVVRLRSATPAASIAVRFDDDEPERWRLYTGEMVVPATSRSVVAKAIRYGYGPSEEVTFDLAAESGVLHGTVVEGMKEDE